jgi:hypothetical protein
MSYDLNSALPQSETAERYEALLTDEERAEHEWRLADVEAEHRYKVEREQVVKLDEAAEQAFAEANLAIFEEYIEMDEIAEQHDRTVIFFTAITGLMTAAREHYGKEIVDVYLAKMFPVPWPMRPEAASIVA